MIVDELCTLLMSCKRDEELLPIFLEQYRKIVGNKHKIILGSDKDKPIINQRGLKTIDIAWTETVGKNISEAMWYSCMMTGTQGCIKIDCDCFVRSMDWVDFPNYQYIGHGLKANPNYPIGLCYFIAKNALGLLIPKGCKRFKCKNESDVIFRNLDDISQNVKKIYRADEEPRKVSQYSWNKNDSILIHCGEFKKDGVYDREATRRAMLDLTTRFG